MSSEKNTKPEVDGCDNPMHILEEKELPGDDNYVLKKVRLIRDETENNIRLLLSGKNLNTSVIFAGDVQGLIHPQSYDRLFNLIDSRETFYNLSELIRLDLKRVVEVNSRPED